MRHQFAILAATFGIVPEIGWAQESVIELDPVVVSAGTGSGTGGSGTGEVGDNNIESETITEVELERTNPQDLQDVFKSQPAVTVGSSIPVSQKIYVQGVEETNLAVTVDGTRQNNKIFHHNATTLIDPELLKAVRVDPGVAPADAGPGALGGAIAFETKDVDDLLPPGKPFGGNVSGEYITNGDIWTTSGTVFGRYLGFEALAFGKIADGDLREDGNGNDIVGSGTSLVSGLGKLAYEAPTGDRIEAAFEIVNDDDARPYRANIGNIIGGRPVPLTRDYDLERHNYTLTYTDETPLPLWDPKVQIGYSMTDLGVTEPDQEIFGKTDSLNGRAQNTFAGRLGTVTLGTDFYVDEADYVYNYHLDHAFDEDGRERAQNVGVYGQARLDVTERARLHFGQRADFQRFEGVDGYEQTQSGASFNAAGEVDLTHFLTAHVGGSHIWAGVPLAENFIINPAWVYEEDIVPTTSDNLVAGLRAHHRGWTAAAKVFQTKIYDARIPDYTVGPGIQRNIRTRGYEFTAGYQGHGIEATLGYAYIDADIDGRPADSEAGRYLTTPVGHVVKASAAYTFPAWGVTIGADTEIAFENDDTWDVDIEGRGGSLPGYEVVNAFVEVTPPRFANISLRAEANNIFDEAYVARGTYGQEYPGVDPLREPGRSFLLRATARF